MRALVAAALLGVMPAGDAALLPGDGFLGAWNRTGAPRVYGGPELYDYIDGGAEIVYEHGFEHVTVQRYRAGEDEMAIELYAMRDPAAALGVYLARCGREAPARGLADRHTAGRHQLMLVRDRYFVIVDNLSGKAERAAALVDFGRAVASRLPPAGRVEVLDLLPTEGRVAGSERLIRGPLALQAFILLGEGDVLRLGGRITAVAAGYTGGAQGPRTLVIAPYPDAETAARAFAHVRGHLDREIQVLSASGSRLVFRDYSGRVGIVVLSGARLELTLGLGRQPAA